MSTKKERPAVTGHSKFFRSPTDLFYRHSQKKAVLSIC